MNEHENAAASAASTVWSVKKGDADLNGAPDVGGNEPPMSKAGARVEATQPRGAREDTPPPAKSWFAKVFSSKPDAGVPTPAAAHAASRGLQEGGDEDEDGDGSGEYVDAVDALGRLDVILRTLQTDSKTRRDLQKIRVSLGKTVEDSDTRLAESLSKSMQLTMDLSEVQARLESEVAVREEMERASATSTASAAALASSIGTLSTQLDENEALLLSTQADNAQLSTDVASTNDRLAEANEGLAAALAEADAANTCVASKQAELDFKLASKQSELDLLNDHLARALEERLIEKRKSSDTIELQGRFVKFKGFFKKIQAEHSTVVRKLSESQKQLESANASLAKARTANARLSENYASANAKLDVADNAAASTKTQLSHAQAAAARLARECAETAGKLAEVQAEWQAAGMKLADASTDTAQLKLDLKTAKASLAEVQATLSSTNSELSRTLSTASHMTTDMAASTSKVSKLQAKVDGVQGKVASAEASAARSLADLHSVNARLAVAQASLDASFFL